MRALPIIVTAAVLTGCVAEDNPNRRATLGAAIGALSGAVLGHQVNHGSGKWVGLSPVHSRRRRRRSLHGQPATRIRGSLGA